MEIKLNQKHFYPYSVSISSLFYRFVFLLCVGAIVASMLVRSPLLFLIAFAYCLPISFICFWKVFLYGHSACQLYPFKKDLSFPKRLIILILCPIAEMHFIKQHNKKEVVKVFGVLQSLPPYLVDYPDELYQPVSSFYSLMHLLSGYAPVRLFVMNDEMLSNILYGLKKEGYAAERLTDTKIIVKDGKISLNVIVFTFKNFRITSDGKAVYAHEYDYLREDKNSKGILKVLIPALKEIMNNEQKNN